LVLFSFIVGARLAGWDKGNIAAGSFAILAVAAFAAILLTGQSEHEDEPVPTPEPDPYTLLHLLPAADHGLITVSYRHLLRVAARREGPDMLDTLERAYRRVGTPAARAAYDLRAAGAVEPPVNHGPAPERALTPREAKRPAAPALGRLGRLLPSGRRE